MAVIKLTKDNFDQEVIQSDKPVLIDFYYIFFSCHNSIFF